MYSLALPASILTPDATDENGLLLDIEVQAIPDGPSTATGSKSASRDVDPFFGAPFKVNPEPGVKSTVRRNCKKCR